MPWIPLTARSQYSILDSTASLTALVEKAAQYQIPVLGLADQGNLYGAVDFYKACKGAKIRPLFGCTIWLAPGSRKEKKKIPGVANGYPITLFAKNQIGYTHLCKLSSFGFLDGFYYQPRIDKELLTELREGLICLSGTQTGPIGAWIVQDKEEKALEELSFFQTLFGSDFYLELQRTPLSSEIAQSVQESWLLQKMEAYVANQEKVNLALIDFSKKYTLPLVATHPIHYIEQEDWRAHEILLNVQSGEPCETWERDSRGQVKAKIPNPKRDCMPTRGLWFKSPEEMEKLFSDLPEAIAETERIGAKCAYEFDFKTKHYPVFIPPSLEGKSFSIEERLRETEQFLRTLCHESIPTRYNQEKLEAIAPLYPNKDPLQVVKERLEYELSILISKGMSDYMLIVYDFIAWAKKQGIPMGPGRGSAAGSIISYLIGITDIEPLRFHLFFERFINPERISYPDIDVDICMARRQEVIDYVVAKYGQDKVAQIITFGTMKAKMAIRDVGRVLNVPLSKVNQIAALVPEDPGMTLEKAFQIDPELSRLMEVDEEAKSILTMAKKIEGSIRNTSTHAAGLIISANPITEHVPVCTAKDSSMVVTQYAMKPVESIGMLKIDFLGLKTLTSIQKCVEAVAQNHGKKIDWSNLPLKDSTTFTLLNQGKTLGVFQLESGGMQELSKHLHIDTFKEIIAVNALYRPGPMDMIPSFIQRKLGKEAIEMDHPLMENILSETYGVMVYQEQVMQIASALAGYTLGEGDVLRRAMGKKDHEEMGRQRAKFLQGAAEKNIPSQTAGAIFDKIEKFASYGFNKSHAAAYAYLSYATAYFKANYPKEWMAALMTCDRDDTTKLSKFIGEAKAMQIPLLPPDINQAGAEFTATPEGIRFAMAGIKGVGEGVVEAILEERKKNGPYTSLYNFIERTDKSRVTRKPIELLVDAGAFDSMGWSRDAMRLSIDPMFEQASAEQKEASLGILNLFSLIEEDKPRFSSPPPVETPSSKTHLLQREKELLGFYLTGHPMDSYKNLLQRLSCVPLKEVENLPDPTLFRAAFVVETMQIKVSSKNQKKFAILVISDGLERLELPIWSELFETASSFLYENQLLYAILQLDRKEGRVHLSCRHLEPLTTLTEARAVACDTLYDQLKAQVRTFDPKKRKEKAPVKQDPAPKKQFTLRIDADRARLSHILSLKEIFRAHPGSSPLLLQFESGSRPLAELSIASEWGVDASSAFEEKLKKFFFIVD